MDDVPDTAPSIESVPSSRSLPLTREELQVRLMVAEKQFRRSCDQVTVINRKMKGLEQRYYKARAEQRRSYRYILRMRLMSTENVRDMFYMYAAAKADEIMALRKQLGAAWEEQLDDVTDFVDSNATDSEDEDGDVDVVDDGIDVEEMEEDVEDVDGGGVEEIFQSEDAGPS